jgi:hypothetical protein
MLDDLTVLILIALQKLPTMPVKNCSNREMEQLIAKTVMVLSERIGRGLSLSSRKSMSRPDGDEVSQLVVSPWLLI